MNRVEWLKQLQQKDGLAIEIGVGCGNFSLQILENTNFTLYSIDCWELNKFNPIPDESYNLTINKLAKFKERSIIIKHYSNIDIANKFLDKSIDFIYLDGDHFYDGIKNDINIWLPKVKIGGIIAGHDYAEYSGWGVIQAVNEKFNNVDVIPVGHFDDGGLPSWAVTIKGY